MDIKTIHPEIKLAMLRKYMAAFIEHLAQRERWRLLFSVKEIMPHPLNLFPTFDEWVEWQFSHASKIIHNEQVCK